MGLISVKQHLAFRTNYKEHFLCPKALRLLTLTNPMTPTCPPPQTLKTLVFRTLSLTISKFPSICWPCLCSGNVKKVTFYTWAALRPLDDQRYPPKFQLLCHSYPSASRHLQMSTPPAKNWRRAAQTDTQMAHRWSVSSWSTCRRVTFLGWETQQRAQGVRWRSANAL